MVLRWLGRAVRAAYRPFAPLVDRAVIHRFRQLVDRSVATGVLTPQTENAVVASFRALYDGNPDIPPRAAVQQAIIEQFQRLYYHSGDTTWRDTWYRGVRVWKCPLDLWLYQEILHDVRPALIVETGTAFGGSAYFLGDVCELLGRGQVVTIDTLVQPDRPEHPRVTYLTGSSTAPEIVARVRAQLPADPGDGPVLVILDSDHARDHVLAELRAYGPMVTVDSYVVVEDTNINGHPVYPGFGPGPMEAVDAYLAETEMFVVDESRHKFLQTFNPRGYLRKVAGPRPGRDGGPRLAPSSHDQADDEAGGTAPSTPRRHPGAAAAVVDSQHDPDEDHHTNSLERGHAPVRTARARLSSVAAGSRPPARSQPPHPRRGIIPPCSA